MFEHDAKVPAIDQGAAPWTLPDMFGRVGGWCVAVADELAAVWCARFRHDLPG